MCCETKKTLDNHYCLRLQMSRLIHELIISPIKALRSDGFEPQGLIVQGAQELFWGLLIAN
jgi:hypothetical protein